MLFVVLVILNFFKKNFRFKIKIHILYFREKEMYLLHI